MMNKTHKDLDDTPMQCGCYTRGQDKTFHLLIGEVNNILDGNDNGIGANVEPWGSLRKRLRGLVEND